MKKLLHATLLAAILLTASCSQAETAEDQPTDPSVITCQQATPGSPNQWIAFRKDFNLDALPSTAVARIAVDSKYWLWINGKPVVFEGALKRGPNPADSYMDEVDIRPFLRKGENKIAVLLWYFGKSGFSHVDSGQAQLLFDCPAIGLASGSDWLCRIHPAFGTAGAPAPNYRLSESSILFDARADIEGWQTAPTEGFEPAAEVESRLGSLHLRPIPQWKDYGVKPVDFVMHPGADADTAVALLPYNMQMTPVITLNDPKGGNLIKIQTNHIMGGSEPSVHGEYITKQSLQTYENLGWMNGEEIHVILPKDLKINKIEYRETGYDTEFAGSFECDDEFFNRFWKKGLRTLYVNMRDTYFDCPDRERAQWWGDATLLSAECAYAFSPSAHLLTAKGIRELCAWQKPNGSLHSPIPGNYESELPAQMLASVGYYGFWTYYMNTGDEKTIIEAYPAVRRYLATWKLEENGLTAVHEGGWNWGDWGDDRDIRLIQAAWYYIALDAACKMAELCGANIDIAEYRADMQRIKDGFNNVCWNGEAYRHPEYEKQTDDRVQALAIVSGIAPESYWPALDNTLHKEEHASPYMEKYVMEALFKIGDGKYAMERVRRRFADMVNDPYYSTLWEGWGILGNGFGGGTVNHAWSGGAMIVIAQKLLGINPMEPGYKSFSITPLDGFFHNYNFSMESVNGTIALSREEKGEKVNWKITVPKGCTAFVTIPGHEEIQVLTGGRHRFTTAVQ